MRVGPKYGHQHICSVLNAKSVVLWFKHRPDKTVISYDSISFLFMEAGNIDYRSCHVCQVLLNECMFPFSSPVFV